jgi:hypothetical protein
VHQVLLKLVSLSLMESAESPRMRHITFWQNEISQAFLKVHIGIELLCLARLLFLIPLYLLHPRNYPLKLSVCIFPYVLPCSL